MTATIGNKVGKGALWSLLNNVVLRLGVLVSGIALARILSPADYGVFAVALVAMTLLQAFNELGVSLALVRWERDVREFAPTAMTIAVASSSALYAITFFAAPVFCEAMGSPSAVGVLRVLCLAVVLDGIAVVPAAILNREFMQARRFLTDFASFSVSTSITITMALNGFGPMSFAVGQIAGNVVSVTIYLFLCPVKIKPGWDRAIAKDLIAFGLPLAGSSLLVLSVTNVDKIAIGAMTDEVTLGLYLMAFNQSSLPLQVFSEAARRVSLAGFSRLLDDRAKLEDSLARGAGLLMAATIPVCVLLACYAQPMLSFVYGEKWTPAAQALQILAVLGLIRVVLFIGYDLLVAFDSNRLLLGLQALWLGAMLPTLLIGTRPRRHPGRLARPARRRRGRHGAGVRDRVAAQGTEARLDAAGLSQARDRRGAGRAVVDPRTGVRRRLVRPARRRRPRGARRLPARRVPDARDASREILIMNRNKVSATARKALRDTFGLWPMHEAKNNVAARQTRRQAQTVRGRRDPQARSHETATLSSRPSSRPTSGRNSCVAAVNSALQQTVTDQVVIVVDDGAGLPALPEDPRLHAVSLSRNTARARPGPQRRHPADPIEVHRLPGRRQHVARRITSPWRWQAWRRALTSSTRPWNAAAPTEPSSTC